MTHARMIAALYVVPGGVYWNLPGVDPWPESRDARRYPGPWPAVAHPPCERWGRYWHGGPSAKVRRRKGDDGRCFEAAIASVRKWGGVLEHPEASAAWEAFGLVRPPRAGGWVRADLMGWTCCVEQGHYGHRARKATWLYAVRVPALPELRWGPSPGVARLDQGFHSAEERVRAGPTTIRRHKRLNAVERITTPLPFRDLLLGMARSVSWPPPGVEVPARDYRLAGGRIFHGTTWEEGWWYVLPGGKILDPLPRSSLCGYEERSMWNQKTPTFG